jgi:hypothetical protein
MRRSPSAIPADDSRPSVLAHILLNRLAAGFTGLVVLDRTERGGFVKALGVLLVIVGLVFALTGGFSFRERDTVVDLGAVEVNREETHRFPVSPVVGGLIAAAGVGILAFGRKGRPA